MAVECAAATTLPCHLRLVRIVVVVDHPLLHHPITVRLGFSECVSGTLCTQTRLSTEPTRGIKIPLHASFVHFPVIRVVDILPDRKALYPVLNKMATAILLHNCWHARSEGLFVFKSLARVQKHREEMCVK